MFTAAIGLAQRIFVATTGQTSDAAIVGTTLVVATLYAPLRKRLELVVDRRFKYEDRLFGSYANEVRQLLSLVEPGRAARRLVKEAVSELEAVGGAVIDATGVPHARAGEWPVPMAVWLPIPGSNRAMSALVVGPRTDGRPHDPRDIATLDELVSLVAAGVVLHADERPPTTTPLAPRTAIPSTPEATGGLDGAPDR